MIDNGYELIAKGFRGTADVPKDEDVFYRCTECGVVIPSVPDDNIGCECGNVFIDKDCWRLVVADLDKFEVVKRSGN